MQETDPIGREDARLGYEKCKKELFDKKRQLEFYQTEIRGIEDE